MSKQLQFKICPHCGSANVHQSFAYPFDKRIKFWWCGNLPHGDIPAGCGWVWCKPFAEWVMAKNLQELEELGGYRLMRLSC